MSLEERPSLPHGIAVEKLADRIRSVRTDEYLYIRNFFPKRPFLMPSNYKDSKLILIRLRELHAEGKLSKLLKNYSSRLSVNLRSFIFTQKILGKLTNLLMNPSTPKP